MNATKSTFFVPAAAVCGGVLLSSDAFAYIDPGTGTLLIQWLFGMAVASLAVLRIHWYRAKAFFSGKFRNTDVGTDADAGVDDAGSE